MIVKRLFILFISLFGWQMGNLLAETPIIDSLKIELHQIQNDSLKAELFAEIADHYYEENFDSTIHYYGRANKLSAKIPYFDIQLSSLRSLGYVNSFRKNDSEAALDFFNQALELGKLANDSVAIAYVLSDIGRIYWKQGKSYQALEYHLQVKQIGEKIKNLKVQLRSNLSLGIIENEEGRNDNAIRYYKRAGILADTLNKTRTKGLVLNNMGKSFQDEKKFDKAYDYYIQADSIFTLLKDNGRLSLVHSNIGENYNLQNKPDKGIFHFKKADDFNAKIQNKERQVMILLGLSNSYSALKKHQIAINFAKEALILLKEIDTNSYYDELYLTLGKSYELQGNTTKSLEYFKLYTDFNNATNKLEQSKKISELKFLFDLEKKEKTILALRATALEKEKTISKTNAKLVKMFFAFIGLIFLSILVFYRNRMKEVERIAKLKTKLSVDLHDNVGASLNHIKMLSNRVGRDQLSEKERKVNLSKIKDISNELMYSMHDMVWALDQNKEAVGNLLERMQDHADNTLSDFNIPFHFDVDEVDIDMILSADKKINIYLIFKESINNIIKHTETSKVIISFRQEKNKLFRIFISNDYLRKKGTNKISNRMGIANMKKRAREIGGELSVFDANNNFKVELSL